MPVGCGRPLDKADRTSVKLFCSMILFSSCPRRRSSGTAARNGFPRVRENDGRKQPVTCSATKEEWGVRLETGIYGAANSAVNVIVSPARPSWEPTGATLTSLASGGPPPVTVRVYIPGRTMTS
jgi:hypothetical protein